ncbi:Pre-mRNA-splicing factor cwf16 [Entomophthora muscae]|uniref:Pre-mRNA-splicing factor cwf16 n=1 Tax=Entomophthora muscae TaxID=34485 RepID=A0ACC2RSV9_9FUNG|nr:Pre-mRNA-splicing factor cwf16 [Entomophthora muscae]
MSERKVLNKYYPPDFDPALIPRRKMPKDQQHKVRLMTPFSMRCETCGEYIYKGKKFNARKETVAGETYYTILIFRFYIRCPRCSAEITFKTDPKNADYVAEHGATRNFEPWRDEDIINQEKAEEKQLEEENNPLKALENRTIDSKRELEIMEGLDEIRTRNARMERIDSGAILDKMVEINESDEDEKIAQEVFKAKRKREEEALDQTDSIINEGESSSTDLHIKKLLKQSGITQTSWAKPPMAAKKPTAFSQAISVKAKPLVVAAPAKSVQPNPLASLVADYDESDESS